MVTQSLLMHRHILPDRKARLVTSQIRQEPPFQGDRIVLHALE
jgi:hypothetical protein